MLSPFLELTSHVRYHNLTGKGTHFAVGDMTGLLAVICRRKNIRIYLHIERYIVL